MITSVFWGMDNGWSRDQPLFFLGRDEKENPMTIDIRKLAWGYLRVSTEGQLDGFGFERQCEAIQTYADRTGYILLGVTMEQYTGKEAERPALEKLIAFCRDNGIKTIIVECSDRFARYLEVQTKLIYKVMQEGLTVHSAALGLDLVEALTGSPDAAFQVKLFGLLAEWERGKICDRLASGRKAKRAKTGRCEGQKPFGYFDDEKECYERMKHLVMEGKTRKQTAITLNGEGFRTRSGTLWNSANIQKSVTRIRKKLRTVTV